MVRRKAFRIYDLAAGEPAVEITKVAFGWLLITGAKKLPTVKKPQTMPGGGALDALLGLDEKPKRRRKKILLPVHLLGDGHDPDLESDENDEDEAKEEQDW